MPRPQLPPAVNDSSFGARVIRYRLLEELTRKDLMVILQKIAPVREKAIQRWEIEGVIPRDHGHYREMLRLLKKVGL